jgi:hypothetical protein
LGSGDVDFRYPYADHHVTFTLCGCLFVSTAPINLLSVGVLVERRGMSCFFSPAGITEVFFPSDHPKLPGLVFRPNVTNRLSFLTLVFIPPASIPNPSVFPVPSCPISLPTIPADSSTPSRLHHTTSQVCTTAGQAHDDLIHLPDFCMAESLGGAVTIVDVVENRGAVVGVDVVAGIGDVVGVLNGGAEDPSADVVLHGGAHTLGTVRKDACFSLDDDATIMSHGGADAQPDVVALVDVDVDVVPVNGSVLVENWVTDSSSCWGELGDPNTNRVQVGDNFILRSSAPFSHCISSLPSPLNSNNTTCLLYDYSLFFSCNNFLSHFSPLPSFFSPFSTSNLSLSLVSLHFKVSSLSAIIFPFECSRTISHLNSASGRCHGVTLNAASGGSAFATLPLPSSLQTKPGIPYKSPVPDLIPLAHSHIAVVLNTDWSPQNNTIVASGRVDSDGMAMIWNVEDSGSAFRKGWSHEGRAGFVKTSIPSYALHPLTLAQMGS